MEEFETYRMSPRESAENGRMAPTGQIEKFLSILSSDLKSTIKITL